MAAAQREPKPSAGDADTDDRTGAIGDHVLRALGRPGDVHRVVVKRLWRDHYRVNVVVGTDITSTTIAHSYFLVTGDDGTVSGATPPIKRHYKPAATDEGRSPQAPS